MGVGFCCIDSGEEGGFLIDIMGDMGGRSGLEREIIEIGRGKGF